MEYESNMELVDSEAPVTTEESPSPEAPTEEVTPQAAEEVKPADEPVLYETPDGRKVDADTLQREWKENFLPEFTRKSQELAELKKINSPQKNDEPSWKNPDYVPKDYAEVIELAKREAIAEIQNSQKQEQERIAAIENEVNSQLSEIKKTDPKLDENSLFIHANKYGFKDLKTAYQNMQDMRKVVVDTEQRTVKNLKTREADPIATVPGNEMPDDGSLDPGVLSKFDGASEYLSFLKGKK